MGLHFNFALGPHIMYQSYIPTPSNLRIQDQGPSVLPSPVFSEGGKEHLLNLIEFRWRSRDLFLNWTSHNILYPRTTFHRPSSTPQKWLCLHLAFHGYQSQRAGSQFFSATLECGWPSKSGLPVGKPSYLSTKKVAVCQQCSRALSRK